MCSLLLGPTQHCSLSHLALATTFADDRTESVGYVVPAGYDIPCHNCHLSSEVLQTRGTRSYVDESLYHHSLGSEADQARDPWTHRTVADELASAAIERPMMYSDSADTKFLLKVVERNFAGPFDPGKHPVVGASGTE